MSWNALLIPLKQSTEQSRLISNDDPERSTSPLPVEQTNVEMEWLVQTSTLICEWVSINFSQRQKQNDRPGRRAEIVT